MSQLIDQLQQTTIERRKKAMAKYGDANWYKPTDKEVSDFYHSPEWNNKRIEIIKRDGGIDLIEVVDYGRISPGNVVHHIVPLREAWDGRLDPENLETTSGKNHNREHIEKGNKSLVSKRKKIELLKTITNVVVDEATEEL